MLRQFSITRLVLGSFCNVRCSGFREGATFTPDESHSATLSFRTSKEWTRWGTVSLRRVSGEAALTVCSLALQTYASAGTTLVGAAASTCTDTTADRAISKATVTRISTSATS